MRTEYSRRRCASYSRDTAHATQTATAAPANRYPRATPATAKSATRAAVASVSNTIGPTSAIASTSQGRSCRHTSAAAATRLRTSPTPWFHAGVFADIDASPTVMSEQNALNDTASTVHTRRRIRTALSGFTRRTVRNSTDTAASDGGRIVAGANSTK